MSLRKFITLVEEVVQFPGGGTTAQAPVTPNLHQPNIDDFTKGYAEIGLHVFGMKNGHEPEWSDLEPQTARAFVEDCKRFQGLNGKLLQQLRAGGMTPYQAGSAFYALRNGLRSQDWLGLGNLWHAMDRAANVDLFPPFRLVEENGMVKAEYEAMAESVGPVDLDRIDLYISEALLKEFEVIPGGAGQTAERPHSYSLDPFTQGYVNEAVDHEEDAETGEIGWDDLPIEMARKMMADCQAFQQQNAQLLQQAYAAGLKPAEAGKLFFLSRNRLRGVGFDADDHNSDMGRVGLGRVGQQLAKAASRFGQFWISQKKIDTNLYKGPLHERVRVWEFNFRDAVQKLARLRPSEAIPTDGAMHPTDALLRSPELAALKRKCAILQSYVNTNTITNDREAAADPYPTRLGPIADRTDAEREHMDLHLDRWVPRERQQDRRAGNIDQRMREIENEAFALGEKYGVNGVVVLALAVQDFSLGYDFKYY